MAWVDRNCYSHTACGMQTARLRGRVATPACSTLYILRFVIAVAGARCALLRLFPHASSRRAATPRTWQEGTYSCGSGGSSHRCPLEFRDAHVGGRKKAALPFVAASTIHVNYDPRAVSRLLCQKSSHEPHPEHDRLTHTNPAKCQPA